MSDLRDKLEEALMLADGDGRREPKKAAACLPVIAEWLRDEDAWEVGMRAGGIVRGALNCLANELEGK